MAIYVGRWDCNACGHKGVLGPETQCPNCSAARPKDVVFYQAAEKEVVQDEALLQKAKAGADWRCSYCGGNNKAWEPKCTTCGNPKSVKGGDENLAVVDYTLTNTPRSGEKKRDRIVHPDQKPPPKKSKWKGRLLIGIGVLLLLIFLLGYTKESTVEVVAFDWERTITVEQYIEVEEEAWDLPSRGRLLKQFRAVHHYNKVLDHYETRTRTVQEAVGTEQYVCGTRSLGNGYMEDKYCTRTVYESRQESYEDPVYRKEPVYQQRYQYAIFRWKPANPIHTKGDDQDPEWGNMRYIEENDNLRVRQKEGIYRIVVKDKNEKKHEEQIPFEKWRSLKKGQELKAKEGIMGGYRGLGEL